MFAFRMLRGGRSAAGNCAAGRGLSGLGRPARTVRGAWTGWTELRMVRVPECFRTLEVCMHSMPDHGGLDVRRTRSAPPT
jgi:hypothetical protein